MMNNYGYKEHLHRHPTYDERIVFFDTPIPGTVLRMADIEVPKIFDTVKSLSLRIDYLVQQRPLPQEFGIHNGDEEPFTDYTVSMRESIHVMPSGAFHDKDMRVPVAKREYTGHEKSGELVKLVNELLGDMECSSTNRV